MKGVERGTKRETGVRKMSWGKKTGGREHEGVGWRRRSKEGWRGW